MSSNVQLLDNTVWHALTTDHAHLAIGTGLAKRYPADVALFVGLAEMSAAAYQDLAQIVAPGEAIALGGLQLPSVMPGWTAHQSVTVIQMVSDQPLPRPATSVEVLTMTPADVPDMLHLIELTQPGPFLPRTIEMGQYIGIRQQGQLIALAGERLSLSGYREISAVCTHPDYQGKGYARLLVSRLVNQHRQHGVVSFLHVANRNTRAIGIYESLHFHQRCEIHLAVITH